MSSMKSMRRILFSIIFAERWFKRMNKESSLAEKFESFANILRNKNVAVVSKHPRDMKEVQKFADEVLEPYINAGKSPRGLVYRFPDIDNVCFVKFMTLSFKSDPESVPENPMVLFDEIIGASEDVGLFAMAVDDAPNLIAFSHDMGALASCAARHISNFLCKSAS